MLTRTRYDNIKKQYIELDTAEQARARRAIFIYGALFKETRLDARVLEGSENQNLRITFQGRRDRLGEP